MLTIAEARAWLNGQEEAKCPCCDRLVKTYHRKLPKADLKPLLSLYELSRESREAGNHYAYIHIAKLQGKSGGGDFAKFRYWGLIEAQPNFDDPSKTHSGFWRLTAKGVAWIEDGVSVEKALLVRDGAVVGVKDPTRVTFSQAWKTIGGFDIRELMGRTRGLQRDFF